MSISLSDLCAIEDSFIDGLDLDVLATHPNFRRRGAATMLLRWGCDQADRDGLPVYIDASEAGVPVYEKYGFRVVNGPVPPPEGASAMLREPKAVS